MRKMGLGKYLLQQLEQAIRARRFQQIWIETASILVEAVKLYESSGYQAETGVETARCLGEARRRHRVDVKAIRD